MPGPRRPSCPTWPRLGRGGSADARALATTLQPLLAGFAALAAKNVASLTLVPIADDWRLPLWPVLLL